MTTAVQERIVTDLQKAKSEGGTRVARIREILQTAVAQTVAEVKEGSNEIGQIAKGAIADAQNTEQYAKAKEHYTGLQAKLVNLDGKLAEKYGDRYQQWKQQITKYWETAKGWYGTAKAEGKMGMPDPIQRMQIDLGAKLGAKMAEVGATTFRSNQETKERLTILLQKEAATEVVEE